MPVVQPCYFLHGTLPQSCLPALGLPTYPACPLARLPAVPEGRAVLGKPADMPSYGWDNEYGLRAFQVPAFSATRALVR
jgi:hypothetical protein